MNTASEAGRLWSVDTGHDLIITEPDFVTKASMPLRQLEFV